jgi:hypothetical protein
MSIMIDDKKGPQPQAAPTPEATKRKRRFAPVLTIHGSLQTMTTMVGITAQKDGASGQMNTRTQP